MKSLWSFRCKLGSELWIYRNVYWWSLITLSFCLCLFTHFFDLVADFRKSFFFRSHIFDQYTMMNYILQQLFEKFLNDFAESISNLIYRILKFNYLTIIKKSCIQLSKVSSFEEWHYKKKLNAQKVVVKNKWLLNLWHSASWKAENVKNSQTKLTRNISTTDTW